jgi:hypothetical protein
MRAKRYLRLALSGRLIGRLGKSVLWMAAACLAQAHAQAPEASAPVMLDRVVAVVNNNAILSSDLNDEIRLSVLEPNSEQGVETPQEALERLISRTLIRRQIREEDAQAVKPTAEEVAARIAGIRNQLPACRHQECSTDAEWKAFLDSHGLTQKQVESYLRDRLEILGFIEGRFRQGIHISQEEIETYYRNTLLPQYPPGQAAPPLDQVSKRIEEILLQQQLTGIFSGWLDNLRKQGDIEVLDPSLEASAPEQAKPDQANSLQGGPAAR